MKGRIFIFKTSFRADYFYFIVALSKVSGSRFDAVHSSGRPCRFGDSDSVSLVVSHIFCVEEA